MNVRIKEKIEKLTELAKEIQNEFDNLSPLDLKSDNRDVPMERVTENVQMESGKSYQMFKCPVCKKRISNWENYCCFCGQRLKPKDKKDLTK